MTRKFICIIVIFLTLATFIAFGRTLGNDFINLDDDLYITENNHIQSGINPENIKWAFTAVVAGNWHPLTLLSHTMAWRFFGPNAFGHHLINLLLHVGTVLFLFFFLYRTTKSLWSSAFAAAFFALHPLRVESIAWVSERKDVLFMFFGLASLYAYALYVESLKLSKYLLCLMLFALGLMSKPMLMTLPFVLFLLDYWPLGRWQKALTANAPVKSCIHPIFRILLEKAPFIALTIASVISTLWLGYHKGYIFTSMEKLPFLLRVQNAAISYIAHLEKTFWPVNLAMFYDYGYNALFLKSFTSFLILIALTIAVIYAFKRLPFLLVGWFWYLGTLLPVIGLFHVNTLSRADRYTYLPSIGIAIILAWGIPTLFHRADVRRKILFPAGIFVLVILTFLTWKQCGYWKNSIAIWSHTLQVKKDSHIAYSNLASSLVEKGKMEEAIDNYNKSILLVPNDADTYCFRGITYAKIGKYQQAIDDYAQAIRLKPRNADLYITRGNAYYEISKYQQAIDDFDKAIRLKPDYAEAYNNKGLAYGKLGQYQQAVNNFSEAIRQKPDYTDAFNNRGFAYLLLENKELGCSDIQKACSLGMCALFEFAKSKGICLSF